MTSGVGVGSSMGSGSGDGVGVGSMSGVSLAALSRVSRSSASLASLARRLRRYSSMMSFGDGGVPTPPLPAADSTMSAVSAYIMSASIGSVHSLPPTYTYATPAPQSRTTNMTTLIQLSHRPDDAVRSADGIHADIPEDIAFGSGSGGGALLTGGPGAVRKVLSSELRSSSKLAIASSLNKPPCFFVPGTRPVPFSFRRPPELSMRLAMERPWEFRGDLPMSQTLRSGRGAAPLALAGEHGKMVLLTTGRRGEPVSNSC